MLSFIQQRFTENLLGIGSVLCTENALLAWGMHLNIRARSSRQRVEEMQKLTYVWHKKDKLEGQCGCSQGPE